LDRPSLSALTAAAFQNNRWNGRTGRTAVELYVSVNTSGPAARDRQRIPSSRVIPQTRLRPGHLSPHDLFCSRLERWSANESYFREREDESQSGPRLVCAVL
jgi:hypothetical protein